MKTFKQFLDESKKHTDDSQILKFKKKTAKVIKSRAEEIAKRVNKDVKRQKKENPNQPAIANFNQRDEKTGKEIYSAPGSPERQAEIDAMLALTKKWKKNR